MPSEAARRAKSTKSGGQIRLRECISSVDTDIDLDAKWNVLEIDASVNRCVATATESLKSDTPRLEVGQRVHLHQIFLSMRHTHEAIRELLRGEGKRPLAVSVMPLVRTQIETLYAMCLIIEEPSALGDYLKDGWKKLFIRHIAMREECLTLPRVTEGLSKQLQWIDQMQIASGVTNAERQTIEAEELGISLPAGIAPTHIAQFPTPKKVIARVANADRKRMLMRLYPEYTFLCGFVHFSPASVILSSLLDPRQPFRTMFTSGQIEEMFQKEIAGPSLWFDILSVVQSCSELLDVYPADVELARCCAEAWKALSENTFIGRVVWKLRARRLLGVIA
jgi:hypothetical protein